MINTITFENTNTKNKENEAKRFENNIYTNEVESLKEDITYLAKSDPKLSQKLNSALTSQLLSRLASDFLKRKTSEQDRYLKYIKRKKTAGFSRLPAVWLELDTEKIRELTNWLKKQKPRNLLWLIKQDLTKLKLKNQKSN